MNKPWIDQMSGAGRRIALGVVLSLLVGLQPAGAVSRLADGSAGLVGQTLDHPLIVKYARQTIDQRTGRDLAVRPSPADQPGEHVLIAAVASLRPGSAQING